MYIPSFRLRRREAAIAACLAASIGVCALGVRTFAQTDSPETGAPEAAPQDALKKKRHRVAHKAPAKPAETTQGAASTGGTGDTAQQTADAAPASDAQKAEGKPGNGFDFAAQLDKAGASACRNQVNALATSTMGNVERFNTVSNWSQVAGDKRAVSLDIGQRYAAGSVVPFSVSQVISAPNQQGTCDGFTVQVVPSPLSCAKLRDSIAAQHGQQIADLAGIPLMQDSAVERTMLVPTGADTCVLVATRSFYAK